MGKTTRKGSDFEQELLEALREIWPNAYRPRLKGSKDFGDFAGVGPWLIEAKKWNKWDIPTWIRTVREKIQRLGDDNPWMIVFATDRRSIPGTFVIMPWSQLQELFTCLDYEQVVELFPRRKREAD